MLCAGCHRLPLRETAIPPQQQAIPLGAGYCETSWAPLMTLETAVHTEIVFDEILDEPVMPHDGMPDDGIPPNAMPSRALPTRGISAPLIGPANDFDGASTTRPPRLDDRFDGQPKNPYQPASQLLSSGNPNRLEGELSKQMTDQIERDFTRAMQNPSAPSRQPAAVLVEERPRYRKAERSLGQLIYSSSMPVQQVGHDADATRCTPSQGVTQANHVETIMELLHPETEQQKTAEIQNSQTAISPTPHGSR